MLRSQNVDRWFAFAFGVIFVSVLLYLATMVTNPSALAIRVYVTVLALAAAGVGAILPGFIEIRYKGYLRAGGALALGVLVYVNEPAFGKVPNFIAPSQPAAPVAEEYLRAIDSGNLDRAWTLLSTDGKQHVAGNKAAFEELYRTSVGPLGAPQSRALVGTTLAVSPPGSPPGAYFVLSYRTKFQNDKGPRPEAVVLRANSADRWEVFSHQVSLTTVSE